MEYRFIEVAHKDSLNNREIFERINLRAVESVQMLTGPIVKIRFITKREICFEKGAMSRDAWAAFEHLTMPAWDEPEEAQFPVE